MLCPVRYAKDRHDRRCTMPSRTTALLSESSRHDRRCTMPSRTTASLLGKRYQNDRPQGEYFFQPTRRKYQHKHVLQTGQPRCKLGRRILRSRLGQGQKGREGSAVTGHLPAYSSQLLPFPSSQPSQVINLRTAVSPSLFLFLFPFPSFPHTRSPQHDGNTKSIATQGTTTPYKNNSYPVRRAR